MAQILEKNDMFATPDTAEDLQNWILLHNGSELNVAMTAAGMAWNLAAKLVNEDPTDG